MTDQQAREFVEMLAVPDSTSCPPCPICGRNHSLETGCVLPSRDRQVFVARTLVDDQADALEVARLRD